MKLEAVNSRVAPSNDGYPPRDASQSMVSAESYCIEFHMLNDMFLHTKEELLES